MSKIEVKDIILEYTDKGKSADIFGDIIYSQNVTFNQKMHIVTLPLETILEDKTNNLSSLLVLGSYCFDVLFLSTFTNVNIDLGVDSSSLDSISMLKDYGAFDVIIEPVKSIYDELYSYYNNSIELEVNSYLNPTQAFINSMEEIVTKVDVFITELSDVVDVDTIKAAMSSDGGEILKNALSTSKDDKAK